MAAPAREPGRCGGGTSTRAPTASWTHPERVSELVLFGVTSGRHGDIDWLFRGGLARFFPQQGDELVAALPEADRGGDVVAAYARLLADPDADVRRRATEAWCLWESATPKWPPTSGLARRFLDPDFAYAFARLCYDGVSRRRPRVGGVRSCIATPGSRRCGGQILRCHSGWRTATSQRKT